MRWRERKRNLHSLLHLPHSSTICPMFPTKHKFHKFLRDNACLCFALFHSRSLYWCCTCSWLNIVRFHGKPSNTWQAILHMAAESLTAGISDAFRLFLGSFTHQKHYKRTMVILRTWYVFFLFNVHNHLKQMQKMSYTDSDFLYKIKRYNSCYHSCAHGQSLLCLQLRADEAKGSIQWKMTL